MINALIPIASGIATGIVGSTGGGFGAGGYGTISAGTNVGGFSTGNFGAGAGNSSTTDFGAGHIAGGHAGGFGFGDTIPTGGVGSWDTGYMVANASEFGAGGVVHGSASLGTGGFIADGSITSTITGSFAAGVAGANDYMGQAGTQAYGTAPQSQDNMQPLANPQLYQQGYGSQPNMWS